MSGKFASSIAARVTALNQKPVNPKGSYVLYWVQASPRVGFNHALELACERANETGQPLLAFFALTPSFPGANRRSYTFLLQVIGGLMDLTKRLKEERRIQLRVVLAGDSGYVGLSSLIRSPSPRVEVGAVKGMSEGASQVIVDKGYLRIQREWYREVADSIPCLLTQRGGMKVECNVVVPVELTSGKEEFAARTIRPKIWKHANAFLHPLEPVSLEVPSLEVKVESSSVELVSLETEEAVEKLLERLPIDHSVQASALLKGGETEAVKHLEEFVKKKLSKFDTDRNFPGKEVSSNLSPYLHYGQISPIQAVLAANDAKSTPKSARVELHP